MYLIDITNQLK